MPSPGLLRSFVALWWVLGAAIFVGSIQTVLTARHLSDGMTFVRATRPQVVICGPGAANSAEALEGFRAASKGTHFLMLPANFSTAEASEAGREMLARVTALAGKGSSTQA